MADEFQAKFLQAEERATATLMGFFAEARTDLEAFIRTGNLTVSDQTFFRKLLDETNRLAAIAGAKAEQWVSDVIPEAHSAGWRTHSTIVVPQGALEALSKSTLSLIRQTTDGIRQAVRQTIAQGILQGWSGDTIRDRIIGTGLTNIPHWPSVEYRAGVIARTETMAAYNAGAVDGIVANGARFVRWIASPDEATCPICLPRDDKVYRVGSSDDVANDPYPAAQPLPHIPAHPRCRCTVRAEYRGPDGKVIRQNVADEAPKLPADAMGGDMPAVLPPSIGEIEAECALRWQSTQLELDAISNRMLGLTDGRTMDYLTAVNGHFDEHKHLVIDGPAPASLGELVGFENRAKTLESYLRKVKDMYALEGSTLNARDAAASIGDLLRYTTRYEEADFTASVLTQVRRMKAAGYRITKWKPRNDIDYFGLNTNWQSPDGTIFEMQFHTPASFQVKESNHVLYEQQRSLPASDPEAVALAEQMAVAKDTIPIPPGWDRLAAQP